jgi:hypothetical protein
MRFGRVLPPAGVIAAAVLSVAALACWYLSSQRARLEEQTRGELTQAAQGLKANLSGLSSSALVFFSNRGNHGPDEFARRNPYVASTPSVLRSGKPDCASLRTPKVLNLQSSDGSNLVDDSH